MIMKKLFVTLCLLSFAVAPLFAQKEATKEVKIKLKEGKKVDVFIDGIQYDYAILDLLDQSKIKTMNVMKNTKNGASGDVIMISTINEVEMDGKTEFKVNGKAKKDDPIFIIDGKKSTKKELNNLKPEGIATINVYKGEKAIKEYNAPNGVIVVTTKKKD